MIPSLLILFLLGFWLQSAYRHRFQSPEHLAQFRTVLGVVIILIAILYWGNFFEPLISRLR